MKQKTKQDLTTKRSKTMKIQCSPLLAEGPKSDETTSCLIHVYLLHEAPLDNNRGQQWETASLIFLCLRWAPCANACGTNQGWQPFRFSVAQIYLVLMQESGLIFT